MQAFVNAFENGEGCRVIASAFAAQNSRGGGPQLSSRRRPDAATGGLEAFFIPWGDGFQAVLDHLLGGGDQLIRLHHLMDQVHGLGAAGRQRLAGRHHLERGLRIGQARNALRATGTGENADLNFRQRQLDALGVGGNAAMAGQRQFQRAAHAGTVDGGHPGFAVGFQLAVQPVHLADEVEQLLGGLIRVLFLLLMIEGEHGLDHRQISAAGKCALA